MHTQRFTEEWQLLDTLPPVSSQAEQNTGWIAVANYDRIVVMIETGAIAAGGTVDADIEIATDASGAGSTNLAGKSITQLTDADDNKLVAIEIRPEEMNISGAHYTHIQLELTAATAACLVAAQVWGHAMYQPASTSLIEEVKD